MDTHSLTRAMGGQFLCNPAPHTASNPAIPASIRVRSAPNVGQSFGQHVAPAQQQLALTQQHIVTTQQHWVPTQHNFGPNGGNLAPPQQSLGHNGAPAGGQCGSNLGLPCASGHTAGGTGSTNLANSAASASAASDGRASQNRGPNGDALGNPSPAVSRCGTPTNGFAIDTVTSIVNTPSPNKRSRTAFDFQ